MNSRKAHNTEGETIEDVRRQRDEALAWIEDYKADHFAVVGGQCAGDERHCSCVPHLRNAIDDARRQRDEVGIQLAVQLAALRERLRLAMAVVEASRIAASAVELPAIDRALAAFDAVPCDTLEKNT
jgi:hypothetical protein